MAPDHNHQHHQASRALKPLCSSRCSCCSTNENGSKNKFLKSYKYKHKLKSYNQEKKTSVKLVQERITSINPPRLDCDKLTPAMHSPTTTTNQIDQEFSQDRGQKFRRIIDSTTATPSEQYPDHESALINHKSYHPVRHRVDGNNRVAVTPTIDDQTTTTTVPMLYSRLQRVCRPLITILITLQLIISCQLHTAHAFCPARCHCNDLDLSANCTQITSISIVPMTLNPLLKRLILNQLPIVELSNSLSIYHQLEYLNMNANQLTRIRYQNFNFKPAPHVISLAPTSTMASLQQRQHNNNNQLEQHQSQQQQHLTPESSELHGRHLRQSLERSNLLETNDGELRHHLRELHLADNKLDQLGDFSAYSEAYQQLRNPDELLDTSSSVGPPLRLKSQELEKLAPFLSLSNLELLDLSGNQLVRLHQHTFLGLLKLKHLDLSRNKLEFIDKHALVGLLALQNLKLNSNRLAQHQHQLNQFNQIICRGPLLELERLDLSQDAPPPAPSDQKWPPSLTAANQSASSPYFHPNPIPHQYQHHLQQQQQQQQQQYQPNKLTKQAHHLVLPNEIAICSPRLRQFHLRGLKLKYVQVNAFDNLNELERLDLSENLLEQVPLDALLYSRSNLSYTLRELDLSNTQIEFIAASSFKPLKHLERLNLSRMSQLISFDLASLVTHEEEGGHEQQQIFASEPEVVSGAQPQHWGPGSEQQQQQQRNSERFVNMNLRELRASQNKRLQSFHSSLRARIHFQRLELLDLAGSSELRELQLDKMIELSPPVANNQREQQRQLQVDVSHSNGLNCSACQMSWLVRAVKQQAATTGAMSALGGSVLPLASQMALHSSQPPAAARIAVPATSQLGWSPIPFDPYNSLSVDPTGNGGGATQLSALSKASQAANGQYSANWRQQNELAQLKLLNVEAIICAWPFSMPLVELLNLETNYAPLFNQDCAPQGDEHRPRYLAPADGTQPTSTTFDTPGSSSNFSTLSSSHLHHQAQPNHHYPQRAEARPTNTESTSTTPASLRPALDTPLWAASILVFGLLLIGVGKLIQLLLIYKRRSSTGDGLKISPSFTATTSLDDGSPTTSCSTGSTSPVLNPLCFGTSGALVGHGQHHHHHHNQTTAGKQQQQPTLITSTLPDGGCISTTLNNWPAKNQMLQAQRNQYGQRNEPQRQTMYAGNTRESLSAFAPGNCGGGEPQQQLANNYWPAPADERLELGPGARGSGGRMRDLRAKFQKSFSSSSSSSRTAAANMNSKRKREKKERDALHRSYQEHLRHHQHTAARDQNLNWPQHQQPQPQDSMGPLTVQVGAVAFNNNNQPETNRYNNNKSGDNNNETTRLATTMLPERRAQRPMFHLNAAAAATAPDYQFNGQACRPAAAATGGVQIKEFGGRLWPAGGGSKLKQSNLFLRFVERLSGRSDDDDGVQQKNNHGKTRTSPTAPGNSAGPPFAPGARGQSHVVCNQYDTTTAAVARRNLVVNYATGRRNNNYGDNGNGITSAPPLPPPPPPLPLPPGERAGGLQAQLAAATIYSNHLAEMEILNHYSVCGGGGGGAGETGDTGDDDERHDDEHRLDYNRGGQPMDWPATSGKRPGLERLERARPNNNLVQQQQQQLVTTTPGAHLNAHGRRAHGNIESEQESLRVMTELHLHQAATATTTTAGNQQQQPRQQIEMGNDAGAQGDDDKKAPFALELLDYDVAGCTQLAALNECDRRTQGERVVQFDQDDSIYAHG